MRRYPFFDPSLTHDLSGLQLRPRHAADGQVVGRHQSRHRGFSVEFAAHRAYVPGDDLRYLDWKAYGRSDKRYVRQFEDQRELACYLVLDASASMNYHGDPRRPTKLAWARQPLAALAWLALRQHDAAGLYTFDQQLHAHCQASSQPSQLGRLLEVLSRVHGQGKTAAGPALRGLAVRLRRRGLLVLVSDLLTDLESLFSGLSRLQAAGHEIWILQVLDPCELEFPFGGRLVFRGMEAESPVLADATSLRDAYVQTIRTQLQRVDSLCTRRQILYHLALTDTSPVAALSALVHRAHPVPP